MLISGNVAQDLKEEMRLEAIVAAPQWGEEMQWLSVGKPAAALYSLLWSLCVGLLASAQKSCPWSRQ